MPLGVGGVKAGAYFLTPYPMTTPHQDIAHVRPTARIRDLNDEMRLMLPATFNGNQLLLTAGITDHFGNDLGSVIDQVKSFRDFTDDNDPWEEHDFGAFTVDGERLYWKIDYLSRDDETHAPDASNPELTRRVLTIMLAEEY